jgi:cytoskeletal protein RodZ
MVAAQLRQAREASGLTIQQVAETTKIRSDHIEAIEAGNYTAFSAQVYIRGFVRTYARMLKLNEPQILAALDEELSGHKKFREPPPFTDKPHTLVDTLTLLLAKINWKVSIVVGGVIVAFALIVGVYSMWRHYKTADPLAGLTPGIYQPQNGSSGETIPLPAPRKP